MTERGPETSPDVGGEPGRRGFRSGPDQVDQALAERSAADMLATDRASAAAGVRLITVSPGSAVAEMIIRDDMVNGHGIVHGGMVFLLADTAFAVACNSHGGTVVAAGADITFVSPARVGDVLTATARELTRYGRSGLYDVTVERADASIVAHLRGRSRHITRITHITPAAKPDPAPATP